jgi:SAM-dependent MidA family methyltransferase
LSHHVDFAALAAAAADAGARAFGPIPQGLFLSRLGIAARGERLMAAAPNRAGEIAGAVRRLVHPGRMGVLFKALAIAAPDTPPPPGFDAG